jgi:hypothetical protein
VSTVRWRERWERFAGNDTGAIVWTAIWAGTWIIAWWDNDPLSFSLPFVWIAVTLIYSMGYDNSFRAARSR